MGIAIGGGGGVPNELKRELDADFVVVAPARHDWAVKGSDEIIRGVVSFSRAVSAKVRCILVRWGNEHERSRTLITELGASELFVWKELLSEFELKSLYAQSDALVDQVGEAVTFGLTTPKAMAAGIPVLTCFDRRGHEWCYAETPPLIDIADSVTLSKALVKLHGSPVFAKQVVRDQREWVDKFHSKAVIARKFAELESEYLSSGASCQVFHRIKQKKEALVDGLRRAEWIRNLRQDSVEAWEAKVLAMNLAGHLCADRKYRTLYIGCSGLLFPYLEGFLATDSCAIDVSSEVIEAGREILPSVDFTLADVDEIPYPDASFDLIVLGEQFSSSADLETILGFIRRVMKDGAKLVFQPVTPAAQWITKSHPKFFLASERLSKHLDMNRAALSRCRSLPLDRARSASVLLTEDTALDPSSTVNALAKHFLVSEILPGTKIAGLFPRRRTMIPLVSELDEALGSLPKPVGCVVCEASVETGISASARNCLESANRVSNQRLPRGAFDVLANARDSASNDRYSTSVNVLLQRSGMAEHSSFFDGWPEVYMSADGLNVRTRNFTSHPWVTLKRIGYRLLGIISVGRIRPFFIWDQHDGDGRKLYDLGKVTCSAAPIGVTQLVSALRLFRDYGLALIELPANTVITGLDDVSGEVALELSSYRVLADKRTDGVYRIVVSRSYFDSRDIDEAVVEAVAEFEVGIESSSVLRSIESTHERGNRSRGLYDFLGDLFH